MPLLEDHSVSFIVRIWCEGGTETQHNREWRGSIEHVHSGRRGFFRDIRAITEFMKPHLEQLGIDEPIRFWDAMTADLFDAPPADGSDPNCEPVGLPLPARPAASAPAAKSTRAGSSVTTRSRRGRSRG